MRLCIKFFLVLGLFSVMVGLRTNGVAQTQGESLIVAFAYAPEKIRQGDTWKIYLSVTDPDGTMNRVDCRIEQSGTGYYNWSTNYLKKGMEKQFTGYFALNTNYSDRLDDFVLELSILDRRGNVKKTFRFPLEFNGASEPLKPFPPELEKDLNRRIGTIDIHFDLGAS